MPPVTSAAAAIAVTGGVDTYLDTHTAAGLDQVGRVLGTCRCPATAAGYRCCRRGCAGSAGWCRVGVEGTGAYDAGLARPLRAEGVEVDPAEPPVAGQV
jgi:transposase